MFWEAAYGILHSLACLLRYFCVMRVLITGIRGLVGHHTYLLCAQHTTWELLGTGRAPAEGTAYAYQAADLTQPDQVVALVRWARPDAVAHIAAMTLVDACQENPTLCWKNNVAATQNLVDALTTYAPKAHFVLVSTDFVFDGFVPPDYLYKENDLPAPLSVYGASKLAAEWVVREYPGPWTIVRTSLVYGTAPHLSRDNIYLRVRQMLSSGREYALFTDQRRTPTWAYDLAEGLRLIIAKRAEGVFHIAGPTIESPYTFGQKVAQVLGASPDLIRPLTAEEFRQLAPRPPHSSLSIQKAQTLLGYQPHDTLDALRKIHDSFN
jgi:dTDP-4-dehydrorhamnose reductase